ncbi:MAG: type I DNA topoisomerase [candidate division WOR-3 bacterium]|nr:type I DNA topoisomerase [candidate division WOR-3 bacterium]MCX7948043.1 type I DNA topoisomerase [candidate division WOR-3 bacterium]MDW8151019.1 type I DNA topoisomerase [candidate division WOR-3 bacterium]
MKLIIVESPTKAKTISKLVKGFYVKSTLGHIVDLPEDKMGIDLEDFKMFFIPIKGKQKVIKELKSISQKAEITYISTDPDREGEAIAYHVVERIKPKNYKRIEVHAIIKEEIKKALENPRNIDLNRVHAQFSRRVIDRIIGYLLSPLASKKIGGKLSVGRVQSPTLRLIVEREREIREFKPEKYYQIQVLYKKDNIEFIAKLPKSIKQKEDALKILQEIKEAEHIVYEIKETEQAEAPPEPHRTSTLQQDASKILKISPEETMKIAQWLYENGYITYHRTDSVKISEEVVKKLRNYIKQSLGEEYLYKKIRTFRSKKFSQEAHEAIRPSIISKNREPQSLELTGKTLKIYELIWKRTIASQMESAIWKRTKVIIKAGEYELIAEGKYLVFDGWRKLYELPEMEILPKLEKNEKLEKLNIELLEKETQPPPRYTESTLVKMLEKLGIGRPSTYAQIIKTLKQRKYVKLKNGVFYPTELGEKLIDWLNSEYSWVIDYEFTAKMEENLDLVEEGKLDWKVVASEIYEKLKDANEKLQDTKPSLKQLELAEKLSKELNIELKEEIKKDKNKLSKWIDNYKPPTKKQIELAMELSKKLNIKIEDEILKSQKKLEKWLKQHSKPTPKQIELLNKLSEKGIKVPKKAYESFIHAQKFIKKALENKK